MAKLSRLKVYQLLHDYPVVPLFSASDLQLCLNVIDACYKGGIRVFEFTNRGDFAHELFAEMDKYIRKHYLDMAFGAGTITDAGTASLYLQLGADFIIAPNLVEEVALTCNSRKIAWIPGVATLTEIATAEKLGAETVKIFPGQVLGPEFIKALKGPSPWTSVMATGGVEPNEESLKKWFQAGATCVGIGSQLFTKEILGEGNFGLLEELCADIITIAKQEKK